MRLNELRKDLRSLSGLLNNWGYVKNPGVLHRITTTKEGNKISYFIAESEALEFINFDIENHTIPNGLEKIPTDKVDTSIRLFSECVELISDEKIDIIDTLCVNFIIEVMYTDEEQIKHVICCWHLDKHGYPPSKVSHPKYHLTFGGKHMKEHSDSLGKLLLMPTPRIMYPPLDIVLSCDFIIKNYYEKRKSNNITKEPLYKEIVERAKEKYWKVFGEAFVSKWHDQHEVDNLSHSMVIGI